MIRIQKVYDEIIKENGWSFEEKESKERNLRKVLFPHDTCDAARSGKLLH